MIAAIRRSAALCCCLAAVTRGQRSDTVVRTVSKPVHAGVATLQRELTIGTADGDEHYVLGAIADMAVAPSGNIYVWDPSVPAIRLYDAAGKYVQTIGAKGSGPGEYRAGAGITVTKGGNLLMWDPGNARINVYSPSGAAITSWPTRGGSGTASGRELITADTAGVVYIMTMIWNRQAERPRKPTHGWVRFRSDGTIMDTVSGPVMPPEVMLQGESGTGSFASFGVPFAGTHFVKPSPLGYFVSGSSERLALDVHEPGKPIASIRRDVTLRPVSAHERDSARADVTEHMQRMFPTWSWNGPDIPRMKAAYTELFVGNDGRIWVTLESGPRRKEDVATTPPTRMGAGQGTGRGTRILWSCPSTGWRLFDVYEPSGSYIGQVRVRERVDPLAMRGDYIWAVTCDEDDTPSVGRYRIMWK